jgi:hypothetical protein
MNVGAISAAANAPAPVYTAPTHAETATSAQPTATASRPVAASTPFLNPAIADVAARAAITNNAPPPLSATDPVLYGDSALLIQSYGAVALLSGPLNAPPIYGMPPEPAIRPVEPI